MDPVSPIEQTQALSQAQNKKYILLAVAVIAVIILFLIITIITSTIAEKQVSPQVATQPNQGKSDNARQNSFPSISPAVVDDWKAYQNSLYSLKYPKEWEVIEDWTDGTYLVIQTSNKLASVSVQVNDTSRVSVASMSAGFVYFNLKKIVTRVGGVTAQNFSGPITFEEKTSQNNYYLFESNGKVYYIKLSYRQLSSDPVLEKEFSQIISNFTFR